MLKFCEGQAHIRLHENEGFLGVKSHCHETGKALFPPLRKMLSILRACQGVKVNNAEKTSIYVFPTILQLNPGAECTKIVAEMWDSSRLYSREDHWPPGFLALVARS